MIHWTLAVFIILGIVALIFWIRVFTIKDAMTGLMNFIGALLMTLATVLWMNITRF